MANDVTILGGLLFFFIILAVLSPLVAEEFGEDATDYDVEGLDSYETPSTSWIGTSFSEILVNIMLIPFWTFGIPALANLLILLPMRLILAFLIYRAIRSGGG